MCFCVLLSFAYFFSSSVMFGMQLYLIINNRTTVETAQFHKNPINYNIGIFQNLKMTLGETVYLWFLPIFPDLKLDGHEYKQNNIELLNISENTKL